MTTKKADKAESRQMSERGRFAKMLSAGYTVEVKPSLKHKTGKSKTPKSASRPSKA